METPPKQPLWRTLRAAGSVSAYAVLRYLNILRPPIDVFGIAERLGIRVIASSLTEYAGEAKSEGDFAEIRISIHDGAARQRFTVGHEMGHLLLHDEGQWFRDKSFSGGPHEVQANQFSAELLMPAFMIQTAIETLGPSHQKLAALFQVSERAMSYRLMKLR